MRRRGPRGGPVRPHRLRRRAGRAIRAVPARVRSSGAALPEMEWCGLLPGGGAGLRHRHLGLPLLDARRLAGEMAQVIELGAPDAATPHDLNVGEHWAVEREDALDADAVGDLANREGGAHSGTTPRDAHTFKRLDALLFPFLHADVHAQRVTGPEGRNV